MSTRIPSPRGLRHTRPGGRRRLPACGRRARRAVALSDAYYPGRGVRFDGSPAQPNATTADLYLTITGRASTADLPAVQDWPAVGFAWPAGVAPLSIGVGARFAGGYVASERFELGVAVS